MSDKKANINDITGTRDKDRQGEIFLNVLKAPVVDVFIRYDGRTQQVSVGSFGGNLEIEAIYKLLDMARDTLREREIQALAKKNEVQPEV